MQDRDFVQPKKEEADRAFQQSQKSFHDIRRVRESILIKTALASARGSQSPADASAEAIIDKLTEVKNDAKTQHYSSTTEVTNFQVTAESSYHAVTEAHITAARLISFINEGDSVRVKVAFWIRTVLEEPGYEVLVSYGRKKGKEVTEVLKEYAQFMIWEEKKEKPYLLIGKEKLTIRELADLLGLNYWEANELLEKEGIAVVR